MSKFLKVFSVILALSLTINFFSFRKVNAEPVTATLAAATAVVVGGVIISTLLNELGQQLSRIDMEAQQQGAYDQTVFNASVANAKKIQEAYFNEIASELPESSLDKYQIAESIFDPKKYLSYAGVSSPSELSPDDRLVYYALSSAYSKVNSFYVDEANQGLKLSSDDYIDMLHASVSEAYEAFSGIPLDFSLGNGLGMALLNIPIPSVLFPNLKSQYNFLNCYKPLSGFSKNASGYNFLVDSFSGTHYFVGVYDVKNSIFKKPFSADYVPISPFVNGNKSLWQSFGIKIDWSYSFVVNTVGIFQYDNPKDTFIYSVRLGVSLFSDYPDNYDSSLGSLQLQTTFDDCYLFEFSTEEEAQAFIDGISVDTTYDPSKDLPIDSGADEVVLSPGLSDMESNILSKQIENGSDDSVDLLFSSGASLADDGSMTYEPAVSVDGTDSEAIEKDDSKIDEFIKKSKYAGIFSSLLLGGSFANAEFKLYDQCKKLLSNLWNYHTVNSPPSFKFYYDSNGDGVTENYDVLDLSVLETSLTNSNMEDKSWWSSPIKVIDVIRYIIAAILYGLFIMRLIKRLPVFYGSGPWSQF